MVSDSLPQEVESLLGAHVESYEQLAVLLLVQSEPDRQWSAEDLAHNLRIALSIAAESAMDLCSRGLVRVAGRKPSPHYQYAATGSIASAVSQLAVEYARNPLGVVKALSANAIRRVRTSALRAFADAFVVKRKERDDG